MDDKPWEGKYFREKFDYIEKQNKAHENHGWRTDPYFSMFCLMKEVKKCLEKDWEETHDE